MLYGERCYMHSPTHTNAATSTAARLSLTTTVPSNGGNGTRRGRWRLLVTAMVVAGAGILATLSTLDETARVAVIVYLALLVAGVLECCLGKDFFEIVVFEIVVLGDIGAVGDLS